MSFTPGPWSIDGDILISEYIPCEETVLARVSVIHDLEGHERNAIKSLIAAAPELLEALEEALLKMESDEERIEGEWGSCRSLEQLEKDGDLDDAILKARAVIAKARGEGVLDGRLG